MPGDQDTSYSLIYAVREGRLERVRELISSYGLSYSKAWSEGYVLLCDAVENQHREVAKLLLTKGSKVNSKSKKPTNTPLHYAAINGDIEIVEMLLSRHANINAENKYGNTPLHNAVESKKMEIIELLLKKGANVNARNSNNLTPFQLAVEEGREEIIKLLLQHGANVNSAYSCTYREGYTPLCIAVEEGHEKVVKLLLECGAKIDTHDKDGKTVLQIAVERGHLEIVKVLLKFGAIIDSQDTRGRTALHIASKAGHEHIVIALLEHGSDINIVSKGNRTVLDFAMAGKHSFYNKSDDSDDDGYYVLGHGICACGIISDILERHMVKMKAADLFVSEKNLCSISNNDEISSFQNECEVELARMKSEKVSNTNVSFYDILTRGIIQLAMYARNESIVQILTSDDYKIKFPIYASMINRNFRKGERRKELLEQGEIFHFLFNNFPQLPYDCTEKVFSYLSDEDLRMLIDACKSISISSPNTDINNVVIT